MNRRAQRARRILEVQQQLHRIEEWKLSGLQSQIEELEAAQRNLIRALNDDDALHGLFIDATARRLRSLSEEASRVSQEKEVQLARLAERAAKVVTAERLFSALDKEVQRAGERQRLVDIIERFVSRATQASGKIGGT